MIHYGNLNSLRKFELITEEYKSITGKKGILLRILNFITKNQNSLRKILISLRRKYFITEKRSVFRMGIEPEGEVYIYREGKLVY